MKLTYKYAELLSNIDQSKLESGDVVFCKEDGSIHLMINNQFLPMGGGNSLIEVTDLNHVLDLNQLGFNRDTYELKIGNGRSTFVELEKLNNQFESVDESIVDDLLNITRSFYDTLNENKYAKVNELTELDLSLFPTSEEVNLLNSKLDALDDNVLEAINSIDAKAEEKMNTLTAFADDYTNTLNNERYAKNSELTELDLSLYPTSVEINLLTEKIDAFNNDQESRVNELNSTKDANLEAINNLTNAFTDTLNTNGYIRNVDLSELDLSEYDDKIAALEARIAELESKVNAIGN